jgi:Glyoxalase-like domain
MDHVGYLSGIVLECRDPMELARFYSALTGWPLVFTDDDFAAIGEGPEAVFHLSFQRAPAHEPPTWPDPHSSMQSHLHIKVKDLEAAERSVLELGGTKSPRNRPPRVSASSRIPRAIPSASFRRGDNTALGLTQPASPPPSRSRTGSHLGRTLR